MKKQLSALMISAGIAVLGGGTWLHAQALSSEDADIPFDFHARQANLPAGKYRVSQTTQSHVLQVRNMATGHSIVVLTSNGPGGEQDSKLVFKRYGNRYFLAEVWMDGQPGQRVPKGSLEREVERNKAEMVALATIRIH